MSRALGIEVVLCAGLCVALAGCWSSSEYRLAISRVDLDKRALESRVASVRSPGDLMANIATSPDGKHMVISTAASVVFLDGAGNVLKRIPSGGKGQTLMHPLFSPDSQRVVFFALCPRAEADDETNEPDMATALVAFSPDGKELSRTILPTVFYADAMSNWTNPPENR